jgi:hypothetical protein
MGRIAIVGGLSSYVLRVCSDANKAGTAGFFGHKLGDELLAFYFITTTVGFVVTLGLFVFAWRKKSDHWQAIRRLQFENPMRTSNGSKSRRIVVGSVLTLGAVLIAIAIYFCVTEAKFDLEETRHESSTQVGPIKMDSAMVVSTAMLPTVTFVTGVAGMICLRLGAVLYFRRQSPPPLPPE